MEWLLAAAAAVPPVCILVAGAIQARRSMRLGSDQETAKYMAMLKGENEALVNENARLRTDLAACESDKRRLTRLQHAD